MTADRGDFGLGFTGGELECRPDLVHVSELEDFLLSVEANPRDLLWAARFLEARRPRRDVFNAGRRLLMPVREGSQYSRENLLHMRTVVQNRRRAHLAQVQQVCVALFGLRIFSQHERLLLTVVSFLPSFRLAGPRVLHTLPACKGDLCCLEPCRRTHVKDCQLHGVCIGIGSPLCFQQCHVQAGGS